MLSALLLLSPAVYLGGESEGDGDGDGDTDSEGECEGEADDTSAACDCTDGDLSIRGGRGGMSASL